MSGTWVLLMKRDDNDFCCLPGVGMEPGESAAETAESEMREETGLAVRFTGMIGLYSSLHVLVGYADENRFQLVSTCFEAIVVGGAIGTTTKAQEVGFFSPDDMVRMSIMENHIDRIDDAFAYEGTTFIR